MSYPQAFKIAWSLFWRQVAWAGAILVFLFPLNRLAISLEGQSHLRVPALGIAFLLAYFLLALPAVTRKLMEIGYTDFRLVVRRPSTGPDGLTYSEAVVLSFLAEVLTDLSAGLALAVCFFVVNIIRQILPDLAVPATLLSLALTMPLKAAILLWIPLPGFRIELLNDFECDLPDRFSAL